MLTEQAPKTGPQQGLQVTGRGSRSKGLGPGMPALPQSTAGKQRGAPWSLHCHPQSHLPCGHPLFLWDPPLFVLQLLEQPTAHLLWGGPIRALHLPAMVMGPELSM